MTQIELIDGVDVRFPKQFSFTREQLEQVVSDAKAKHGDHVKEIRISHVKEYFRTRYISDLEVNANA